MKKIFLILLVLITNNLLAQKTQKLKRFMSQHRKIISFVDIFPKIGTLIPL